MSDTAPIHIPLNARLALFIRFFSFRLDRVQFAFDQSNLSLPDQLRARQSFAALREGIEFTITQLFDAMMWREPADTSLKRIKAQFQDQIDTLITLSPQSEHVSEIINTLDSIDCTACRDASGLDYT